MSRSQMLNHIKKYFSSQGNRKFAKYTVIGVSCATVVPAIVSKNCKDDDGNIVATVNGGIRFLRSLAIGVGISIDYYFSMLGLNETHPNFNAMMSRIHQRAANDILYGCLHNGGSYIKLGQGLVSMSHIMPKEYIETLRALQDKCLARKDDEIKKLFLEDFGKDPSEIFKQFESEPIAAASIAQVYKAKTKEDKCVAVKVQYIDLQKRFKSDVATINFLLKIAAFMHPDFNFTWVLADLENALKQELDFINEGLNSERCARDLQHLQHVYIPKVFWDYTSMRVLVTEFIEGYKISEVENLKRNGFSLADIDKKLFEAFGHQIFQTGFVHADPHPGNGCLVLVRKFDGKTQLVLLDHGLYQQVSDRDRIALSYMWKAIVLSDHVNMKKYAAELGVENYELFAEILTQSPLKSHGFKLRAKLTEEDFKYMTQFARDRFDSIICCLQTMPRTLLLVIRNLNTIRAIAHDHGNPVDRYTVLARAATKMAYRNENVIARMLNFPLWIYFEAILNIKKISRWFQKTTLQILYHFGLAPDIKIILAKTNMAI